MMPMLKLILILVGGKFIELTLLIDLRLWDAAAAALTSVADTLTWVSEWGRFTVGIDGDKKSMEFWKPNEEEASGLEIFGDCGHCLIDP